MLLLLLNPNVFLIHLQNTRYCGNAHNDAITENSIIMMPTDTPTRVPLCEVNPGEGKLHVPSVQLDITGHMIRGAETGSLACLKM